MQLQRQSDVAKANDGNDGGICIDGNITRRMAGVG